MTAKLYALSYSPWSEKARWALQHHQLDFIEKEHSPLFGEWSLRWRTGIRERPLTVPILQTSDRAIQDSYRIAQYAEAQGQGKPLFADPCAINDWNQLSQKLLEHGRALLLHRLEQHPKAVVESMPVLIPRLLHKPLRPCFQMIGMWFFRSKYRIEPNLDYDRQAMHEGLVHLRQSLAGGRTYLLADFSYADIAMASVLQMIKPVNQTFLALGSATRVAWTDPELVDSFADLIAWRDRLYQNHRQN